MIGIQLKGRLGNQMFQYAAARTLAESLGCGLLVAGNTPTRRFGVLSRGLGFDRRPPHEGMRQNGQLHEAFGCGPSFVRGRLHELAVPLVRRRWFPNLFRPRMIAFGSEEFEDFDARFFVQGGGTWLDGLFQSPDYFAGRRSEVRNWFGETSESACRVESIVRQWPKPPERMAAVHVRRGDYLNSHGGVGWTLPLGYYRDALAHLPEGTRVALFSDDPDWAAEQFKNWQPWVSRGNTPVVDMLAMARCRWMAIANSSFSWWAAWLNSDPEKTIFAPEFHLGFKLGQWLPGGIAVDGWQYLRVAS